LIPDFKIKNMMFLNFAEMTNGYITNCDYCFIPPLGVFLQEGTGSILEKYFANLTW
jgi:hypothetical protein